ncbi:MAG: CBASS cGAMP-activated phospholipase [Devosia sp.]
MAFRILSLSGGGYRGLFTAEILARLEDKAGKPIGQCFDMIAGTSIGGIIAMGLALGKTATEIRDVFLDQGDTVFPPRGLPGQGLRWLKGFVMPKYASSPLRATIERIIDPDARILDCRTRLLIPTVNMTAGRLQMFKTPHHHTLTEDGVHKTVEVALATSAAPTYFPLAKIGHNFYADGGLAANSPDICAVHEAIHFCGQELENVSVLSIGTILTGYGVASSQGRNWGIWDWAVKRPRLLETTMGVQQQLVNFMMQHDLKERYIRFDQTADAEHLPDIGLDVSEDRRRATQLSLAEVAFRVGYAKPGVKEALSHIPSPPPHLQWAAD